MSSIMKGLVTEKKKKPKPTSPEKWARAKAKARSKFDVYPSAYANAYASKEYKKMGGGWRMGESIVDLDENMLSTYADMFDLDESSFDSYKRDFKRREHEAEWEREQEINRQREGGHWYIRINGKIFKDRNGDPVMFNGKSHANAVAVKMMQKDFNKGKEFILTNKPEDKQQDLSEGENVAVIYIDGKPVSKYVNKLEAERDAKLIRAKYPNKKIEIKDEVREAEGDTLHDPEYSLPEARRITKAIKYDDTVGEIITQIQMLAERTEGIDSKTLEYSIDGVFAAKKALESAVYDLEEAFEDAARNAQYKRDEEELGEDYTGMFAAEKTPTVNPHAGVKDNQFRGAISETPTDNPTGASGEGGWRTYRAKPAGQLQVAEGWKEEAQDLEDWSKEVNMRLYKAHESQRPALARQLSKIEQKNFGSSLNKGSLTQLVHSTLMALQKGQMVHYDPQSVGQMPFGNIVGDDARIIASSGLKKYDVDGYRGLKRAGIVDTIEQFLHLRDLADNQGQAILKYANMPPVAAWMQFIKDIGWSKDDMNEEVQAKTDDKLLTYYAQRKAEKQKQQSQPQDQLDELKCWTGYTRVKGVPAGAVGSCKKKTKESSIMKGISRESK